MDDPDGRSDESDGSPEQQAHEGDDGDWRSAESTGSPEQTAFGAAMAEQLLGKVRVRRFPADHAPVMPNSSRAIARVMTTSQSTVARMGRALALERLEQGDEIRMNVGRDGKLYPASEFDKYGLRVTVERLLDEQPDASLRTIAKHAGVSPATVLRYRRLRSGE